MGAATGGLRGSRQRWDALHLDCVNVNILVVIYGMFSRHAHRGEQGEGDISHHCRHIYNEVWLDFKKYILYDSTSMNSKVN